MELGSWTTRSGSQSASVSRENPTCNDIFSKV